MNRSRWRGFRIELGEVESVLAEHPAVQQGAVVVREDTPGNKRLAAYVVNRPAMAVSAGEYRTFLSSRLPEYMIPSAWVVLKEMPLTPNGKVDRKALPAPESGSESESTYVAPTNPTEELIAGIWARILKVERVGVQDNFFLLGGHSLLVTQVVSHLREALHVELPLRAIFEAPTVAGLAERVEASRREQSGVQSPPLVPVPRDQPLPLSFAQQRLWFIDQLTPSASMYNVPGRFRIPGRLQEFALHRALDELWRRHEGLRTRFPAVDGQPVQVIDPPSAVDLPVSDLRQLPVKERQAEVRRLYLEHAHQPFDLSAGPLARVRLLLLSDDEATLIHTLHHTITDGWSMDIYKRELAILYRAFCAGLESPLPEPPVQYADYAVWQRRWLQGDILQGYLDYWRTQLKGLATLALPTDRPRPPVQTFSGSAFAFSIPIELANQLKQVSRQEGVTLFMTLLAAFQTLLGRYSGQDDVVVGTPIAGRTRRELEGMIGFFVNTLVMRADLSGDPTFVELLRRVREVCLGAYAHQEIPFEKLVEELQPPRDPSRNPLFQVVFGMQNIPVSGEMGQAPRAERPLRRKEDASAKRASPAISPANLT